jgi:hypothetical protein
MEPYEIIGAPYEIWIANAGASFPAIDDAPDGDVWTLLGTSGTRSMGDAGVTISHDQDINAWTPAGATGPVKAFRVSESLTFTVEIADMTLEMYREAMNRNSVTTTVPTSTDGGFREIGLTRGLFITELSLLARGQGLSPYGTDMNAQYEVPRCYESGSPSPQFQKGEPAMLALEFTALEDLTVGVPESERFGRFVAQDTLPS